MTAEISPVIKCELYKLSEPARAVIADLLINDIAVMSAALQMAVRYPEEASVRAQTALHRLKLWESHVRELFNIPSHRQAKVNPDAHLGATE